VASVVGLVIAAASLVMVTIAQLQMGSSWRIGVDPQERTELVRTGMYREVRNPIYTGMAVFAIAQLAILPGWWTVGAAVAMAVGVELQVRAVEEPYLVSTHGGAFTAWAATSGRFVPRVGRLPA
jgi:protein-S-isoprenylcysteine O-methyltransferase Ste14